jgi:AraC family transcriptional regulator of adaptative response / DNA-3-methyladenine glycosylase II
MSVSASYGGGLVHLSNRAYRLRPLLPAVQSKDAWFGGWLVIAVLTTGIYCRPRCPVQPAFARKVGFYPTAAAAQHAGFRAWKRCRPDASPGSPEWNVSGDVVARAMRFRTTTDGERYCV